MGLGNRGRTKKRNPVPNVNPFFGFLPTAKGPQTGCLVFQQLPPASAKSGSGIGSPGESPQGSLSPHDPLPLSSV